MPQQSLRTLQLYNGLEINSEHDIFSNAQVQTKQANPDQALVDRLMLACTSDSRLSLSQVRHAL